MVNRNILAAFIYTSLASLAASIVYGNLLSTYIYSLSNSSEVVGYVTGVSGLAMLLCAWPTGVLTDKWHRSSM
jgi:MFS family permease